MYYLLLSINYDSFYSLERYLRKETELTLAEHCRAHGLRILQINGLHKVDEQNENATISILIGR